MKSEAGYVVSETSAFDWRRIKQQLIQVESELCERAAAYHAGQLPAYTCGCEYHSQLIRKGQKQLREMIES